MSTTKYSKAIFYYFSGTGNARNAAKKMKAIAGELNLDCSLINIDNGLVPDVSDIDERTLIGFFSPTHGFNLPPIMLRFIRKFPRTVRANVFILNTRGGLKLFNIYLPGLTGLGQIMPAIILLLKGYRIVGMRPLDLPSNWIILHPGLTDKAVNAIYGHCSTIVDRFAKDIYQGRRRLRALVTIPIDLLIAPISVAYYFAGRFYLAKTLLSTDECDGCALCSLKCPVGAIEMKKDRPMWKYNCESCMRCINICPKRAIETSHGYAMLMLYFWLFWVAPAGVATYLHFNLDKFFPLESPVHDIWQYIFAILFLSVHFVSYRIVHRLAQNKWVSRIIKYTSLSRLKIWRRYKAPKKL